MEKNKSKKNIDNIMDMSQNDSSIKKPATVKKTFYKKITQCNIKTSNKTSNLKNPNTNSILKNIKDVHSTIKTKIINISSSKNNETDLKSYAKSSNSVFDKRISAFKLNTNNKNDNENKNTNEKDNNSNDNNNIENNKNNDSNKKENNNLNIRNSKNNFSNERKKSK